MHCPSVHFFALTINVHYALISSGLCTDRESRLCTDQQSNSQRHQSGLKGAVSEDNVVNETLVKTTVVRRIDKSALAAVVELVDITAL